MSDSEPTDAYRRKLLLDARRRVEETQAISLALDLSHREEEERIRALNAEHNHLIILVAFIFSLIAFSVLGFFLARSTKARLANQALRRIDKEISALDEREAVWCLVAQWWASNRSTCPSKEAAATLVRIGESATKPLITALSNNAPYVRWRAAWALGEIKDPRAVPPLVGALRDKTPDCRWMAADALRKTKGAAAVIPLVAALRDSDRRVQVQAAAALGAIGDARAVDALGAAMLANESGDASEVTQRISALLDGRFPLSIFRRAAAEALSAINDHRSGDWLILALSDKDFLVRQSAAEGLGKLGDRRAGEPLIIALGDRTGYVRVTAADSLRRVTAADFGQDQLRWRTWWEQTAGH